MSRKDSVGKLMNWFGYGAGAECLPKAVNDDNSPIRALPSNWYNSPEMFDLERRAIFSRKWQLITHKNRFKQPGDWLKWTITGLEVVLSMDRNNKINGFHNVCRHRAYPVVTSGDSGNSKIFSCKYHGWSYGLSGKLAKAPGYDKLDDFSKENNSLYPIHVRIDHQGFVWINLDAKSTPEVAWEDDFEGVDTQERYGIYNMDDYEFDHSWQMDGDYNWKILADNYNECYHCATTHPDIGALADLHSYSVATVKGQIIHDAATTEEQRANGLVVASTYYFPNVSTNISPHFFMIQRFVPHSADKSTMSYQVFRNKHSSDADFDLVSNIYKRIMSEDKALCSAAQQNLNAGVFTNGELHPKYEKGPLHFQKTCRETVVGWREKELREGGTEIWPARPTLPETANVSIQDEDFCKGLSCSTQPPEGLAW
ncbi:unnamed protein product [Zymoseptoria tritici ST99CH_1A5]|uniref:Choline monooxygenase, chloroplastic n=4 Tax=Zymoseptoria tritici TaxID=1047171 RepID=F9X794_ZYMTI|nr:uncharacterized protein MYCGRDRAFT_99625 [Zymoseptoria tritici IPO323]SMQ49051.1 unnamed protein product [Zymoseptoria tritici ST99CH_3D7]SMR48869.1 unnamed protein product [Zymoseptoria tritici ST99CH_1E4]SMR50053.1 unnamed protein product [Zymoseptoria tritici ST99CH_3D1]SMY22753.1 unnamed protein product [Zymoseptoria tritici ST99CH_1A5]EGP89309.1 hypothetical protein MYCGRDRAFT_99625 [Zymoseptoria tritici IPO323]